MNYYASKMRAPRSQKLKSWGPFWSYQIDSHANPAHLPQKWAKWAELAVLLGWLLQTATKISIFSIAMGAKPSF